MRCNLGIPSRSLLIWQIFRALNLWETTELDDEMHLNPSINYIYSYTWLKSYAEAKFHPLIPQFREIYTSDRQIDSHQVNIRAKSRGLERQGIVNHF